MENQLMHTTNTQPINPVKKQDFNEAHRKNHH